MPQTISSIMKTVLFFLAMIITFFLGVAYGNVDMKAFGYPQDQAIEDQLLRQRSSLSALSNIMSKDVYFKFIKEFRHGSFNIGLDETGNVIIVAKDTQRNTIALLELNSDGDEASISVRTDSERLPNILHNLESNYLAKPTPGAAKPSP